MLNANSSVSLFLFHTRTLSVQCPALYHLLLKNTASSSAFLLLLSTFLFTCRKWKLYKKAEVSRVSHDSMNRRILLSLYFHWCLMSATTLCVFLGRDLKFLVWNVFFSHRALSPHDSHCVSFIAAPGDFASVLGSTRVLMLDQLFIGVNNGCVASLVVFFGKRSKGHRFHLQRVSKNKTKQKSQKKLKRKKRKEYWKY